MRETAKNTILNSTKFSNFNATTNRSSAQISDHDQSKMLQGLTVIEEDLTDDEDEVKE